MVSACSSVSGGMILAAYRAPWRTMSARCSGVIGVTSDSRWWLPCGTENLPAGMLADVVAKLSQP